MSFQNRSEAGRELAEKLLVYALEEPLVLALPRGGVPVGFEVAKALGAPLDTLVVRKIGAPGNPEYGVGAIAPNNVLIFDILALHGLGLQEKDLEPTVQNEIIEMERRIVEYKSGAYSEDTGHDTIILVDDGLATGISARAAVESTKLTYNPKKIVFAAPICASETVLQLREIVDELVCVQEVDNLVAIGHWYYEFDQTSDEEVTNYLEEASSKRGNMV